MKEPSITSEPAKPKQLLIFITGLSACIMLLIYSWSISRDATPSGPDLERQKKLKAFRRDAAPIEAGLTKEATSRFGPGLKFEVDPEDGSSLSHENRSGKVFINVSIGFPSSDRIARLYYPSSAIGNLSARYKEGSGDLIAPPLDSAFCNLYDQDKVGRAYSRQTNAIKITLMRFYRWGGQRDAAYAAAAIQHWKNPKLSLSSHSKPSRPHVSGQTP